MTSDRGRLLMALLLGSAIAAVFGLLLNQAFIGMILGVLVGTRLAAVTKTTKGAIVGAMIGAITGVFVGYHSASGILRQGSFSNAAVLQTRAFSLVFGAILFALLGAIIGAVAGRIARALSNGKGFFW